ncbi:hypothetical protein AT15_06225 [Kosmotoga arenicorallina S304]|uniref:dTDP-glucose 4,6-dehydratase n=1 Tax=Kosmotoga arenicorallina S304 TaxID=1453497 RepID=A0A176JU59_9BACT|nr:dTDP-glucose 4,6-dehydratase [Kosmotoga arenicorallina]OAA26942.1 hypothetical protein AT15_06225 [Kosmotoga arenicorallina S304]
MKTILITGGAGFIGSNFVKYILKQENYRVIVLDALTYAGNLDNLKEYISKEKLFVPLKHTRLETVSFNLFGDVKPVFNASENIERLNFKLKEYQHITLHHNDFDRVIEDALNKHKLVFVFGSIDDPNIVRNLVSISDMVVNFSAETHVDRSILDPDRFIKTDVYGTYVLLEAAKKSDRFKKFLHISTDEVYGVAKDHSFTEKDPINPRNPYSASKAAADRLVYAYNQTYGLPVNIVRPSNNFGPFQYPEKLIPVMIIRALKNEYLPVYGDGKQVRDWLFVKDTVRAIHLVLEKGRIGEVYNIAGGNERENIWIVEKILEKLGKPKNLIKFVKDRPGHDIRYSLNDTKIRTELGYTPEWDFETNLEETIEWYVNNESWWRKILNNDKEYQEFMKKWYDER